jgi:kojibiose phosphorylase
MAERYLKQAAEIDLDDTMGNAAGGVHAAASGGIWQALVFGFGGMRLIPDGLALAPQFPRRWANLGFSAQWRSSKLEVVFGQMPPTVEVSCNSGDGIVVLLNEDVKAALKAGQRLLAKKDDARWRVRQDVTTRR